MLKWKKMKREESKLDRRVNFRCLGRQGNIDGAFVQAGGPIGERSALLGTLKRFQSKMSIIELEEELRWPREVPSAAQRQLWREEP